MKMYYYVRLNENNIGIEILTTPNKIKAKEYISIPDYNTTYIYRKWEDNQWSVNTYEPEIDTVLQDKVDSFEALVVSQNEMLIQMQAVIDALVGGGANE